MPIGGRGYNPPPPGYATDQTKVCGRSPQSLGNFCDFLEKNNHFNAIWIKFRTFLEPFERTELLKFERQLKNWITQSL